MCCSLDVYKHKVGRRKGVLFLEYYIIQRDTSLNIDFLHDPITMKTTTITFMMCFMKTMHLRQVFSFLEEKTTACIVFEVLRETSQSNKEQLGAAQSFAFLILMSKCLVSKKRKLITCS